MKRERKELKERENTLPLPTLLRAFNKMDDLQAELALFRSLSQLIAARSRHDCRSFYKNYHEQWRLVSDEYLPTWNHS